MPYLGLVSASMMLRDQFPGIALWMPEYLCGVYIP